MVTVLGTILFCNVVDTVETGVTLEEEHAVLVEWRPLRSECRHG